MVKYYFILTLRKLLRQRSYTLLNVTGLSLGMMAAIFLLQFVAFENGYNQKAANLPNQYRVLVKEAGSPDWQPLLPTALAPALKKDFPEVKNVAAIANDLGDGMLSRTGTGAGATDQSFRENQTMYGDSRFFGLANPGLLKGEVRLDQANTMLLSASYAKKYFGEEDPIGKPLFLSNQFGNLPYTVTGVFKDVSVQTDYPFSFICSMETFRSPANLNGNDWAALENWGGGIHLVFVELNDGATPAAVEKKTADLLHKMLPETNFSIALQPLGEVHLGNKLGDTLPVFGDRGIVLSLFAIALLILLIAWVNYINLTVAQGFKQLQAIGIRKTIGARREELAIQFVVESLFINGLGLVMAILLVQILQPLFNSMIGAPLDFKVLLQGGFWAILAGTVAAGILISGGYVAKVMTGFHPNETLKSSFNLPAGSMFLRKGLIVGQFSITIFLIIASIVLYQQLDFMKRKSLGINIDQLVVLRGPEAEYDDFATKKTAILNKIEALPWVQNYCATAALPGASFTQNYNSDGLSTPRSQPESSKVSFMVVGIDDRFVPTYELGMASGQNFNHETVMNGRKSQKIILNELGARSLGYENPVDIIGEQLSWNDENYTITGILKDYHHQGLQTAIQPMVFYPTVSANLISIRMDKDKLDGKLSQLKAIFKEVFPNDPFEYYFADKDFASQYAKEDRLSSLSLAATAFAIFISCLGLLGLVAYAAERRTKEIGIRKVLGASTAGLVGLLSKDFLSLVIGALVIASPLAYFFMNKWLQDFAFRIDIHWTVFALAGMVAVAVAFLTVSFQSVKAALANPVKSLRSE